MERGEVCMQEFMIGQFANLRLKTGVYDVLSDQCHAEAVQTRLFNFHDLFYR